MSGKIKRRLLQATFMRKFCHDLIFDLRFDWQLRRNQSQFPFLMAKTLDNIGSSGRLGSVVFMLSYAYRDAHDGVNHGVQVISFVPALSYSSPALSIYSGFDASTNSEIQHELEDDELFAKAWMNHADKILPRKYNSCLLRND